MGKQNIVRQDVVQITFDSNTKELMKIQQSVDNIRKGFAGGLGDDALEDLKKGAKDAGEEFDDLGDKVKDTNEELGDTEKKGDKAFAALKKVAGVSFKALAVGLTAAATGVGAIVKEAVASYADYEQLVGGVETLLGAKGAKTVEEYAKNVGKSVDEVRDEFDKLHKSEQAVLANADMAYKTAGVSANTYMETVTGFSASLLQSVGGDTVKAANMADTAMTDMSDNANKMGTSMESIQNAYSGFAKGNFTMLDNLKLGYGGTKEEMARLIKDAAKLDKTIDANDTSFGNIVKSIHAVQKNLDISGISYQEYTKLVESGAMTQEEAYKLLGTTAKEANFTISGSMGQMKAAWSNTLTSLIRGGKDFDKSVESLVESAEIYADNLFPAIEKALGGVGQLVEKLAPKLEEKLPALIEGLLPPLLKAATALLKSFIKALPNLIKTFVKQIPTILKEIGKAIAESFEGIPILGKLGKTIGENTDAISKFIPVVIGLVAALKGFNKIKSLGSGFSGLFGKGGGGSGGGSGGKSGGLFGSLLQLGKAKTKDVLKAVLHLTIIIGALGILLYLIAQLFKDGVNFVEMLQVVALIGALGLVGGGLAKLAGIVGAIPLPVIATGLAGMAIVIGGFALIVEAFGLLAEIPGFKKFLKQGGEILVSLVDIIGQMAGALIGGIGKGITAALPEMGKNLSKFAESLKPMFEIFSNADLSGVSGFFLSLGGFLLEMTANNILSFFGGSNDLQQLGEDLGSFIEEGSGFFKKVATLPKQGFENAAALFESLADIGNIPNTGGIAQWFSGTNDYADLAQGLQTLSSEKMMKAYNKFGEIKTIAFDNIAAFLACISDIGNIPNTGGIAQWFSGTNDYADLATGLQTLSSEKMMTAFEKFGAIKTIAFDNIAAFLVSISDIGNIPNTGGVAQWFSGENDYAALAKGLKQIAGASSFFTLIGSIPAESFDAIGAFFNALGELPTDGGIGEWFSGETDYEGVSAGLKALASEGTSKFFAFMATMPENGVSNAVKFFKCLNGIGNLPNSGGVAQWFTGTVDYVAISNGLGSLCNDNVKGFFAYINEMPEESFTKGKKFFDCLNGIGGLPNSGGIKQWFTGEINYTEIASGLGKLSNKKVKGFFTMVSGMEDTSFSNGKKFFSCLSGIKNLPESGGIFSWFTGGVDYESLAAGLGKLSGKRVKQFFNMTSGHTKETYSNASSLFKLLSKLEDLPSDVENVEITTAALALFDTKAGGFFKILEKLDIEKLNGLWSSLGSAGNLSAEGLATMSDNITTLLKQTTELPKKMGEGIKKSSKTLSNSLVSIWVDAVKASTKPVNKLLSGANHVMKEFGSKKRLINWEPYAKGTNGHKGGNAVVNDGRGAELVQMPNGRMFIPNGRNVFLPNAPRGMKVLSAENTAKLFGKKSPTFRYAEGTGDIDIWSYYDNASGLVDKLVDTVSYKGLNGFALNLGKSIVSTFSKEMPAWIEKQFMQSGMSASKYNASKGVSQWTSTVVRALKMEGQYSMMNVVRTLFQMQTESGGNPNAINLWDSNAKKGTPSKGLMQVIDPTFNAYARKGFNTNIYDPLSNILASIRYATSRYGSLSKAYRGVGYASGVGSITIPEQSSINLSYTPENSYTGGRSSAEYNTYAPQFTLNISGSNDDRILARKVKRWINEAMTETFESFDRKNPNLVEV